MVEGDAEHFWPPLSLPCGPSTHTPPEEGLGQVSVEARSSEASLSSSNNPHTAWNHCPVEKYIMAQLNADQMGGHLAAVVAVLVQCAR